MYVHLSILFHFQSNLTQNPTIPVINTHSNISCYSMFLPNISCLTRNHNSSICGSNGHGIRLPSVNANGMIPDELIHTLPHTHTHKAATTTTSNNRNTRLWPNCAKVRMAEIINHTQYT